MGLFNKLKNALFEEEEIEIPTKETLVESKPSPVIKEDSVEKKPEIEKKNIDALLDDENERDLFKAENTFKFPEFDEEEFKSSYKPPIEKEEKPAPVVTPKEPTRVKPISFDYDRKPKQSRKETVKKEPVEEVNQKKTFRPSPVISPVYGVLDKNYKKEDIITVKEEKPKKTFDVDAIRRKAFGTLEDDIESTFESPKEDFFQEKEREMDDLLNNSVDEQIDLGENTTRESRNGNRLRRKTEEVELETVPSEKREYRRNQEEEIEDRKLYNDIESEMDPTSELQPIEEKSKSEEQKFEEDTLENDLFDLIDSMYDNREDEDES